MSAPIIGIGRTAPLSQTDATTAPIKAPAPIATPKVSGGSGAGGVTGAEGSDFGQTLSNALGDASKAEKTADNAAARFASGDPEIGIHEVMIAAEKANISVRYAVTLKNKLLEAYRELMNTPL